MNEITLSRVPSKLLYARRRSYSELCDVGIEDIQVKIYAHDINDKSGDPLFLREYKDARIVQKHVYIRVSTIDGSEEVEIAQDSIVDVRITHRGKEIKW